MENLLNQLQSMDQDKAATLLMAAVLVLSLTTIAAVAVLRAMGKWGVVALMVGAAVVSIALVR